MKKIFLLAIILFITESALSFGGGGGGHGLKSTTFKGGVNAIGAHFDSNKTAEIHIEETTECPENMDLHHTDTGNICCKKGYRLLCIQKDDNTGGCKLYTCSVPHGYPDPDLCGARENVYCDQPDCNGNSAKCCDDNKILSCAQMKYGACRVSACCNEDETATYYDGGSASCCSQNDLYCSIRDEAGNCTQQNCCGGTGYIFEHAGINGADVCCSNGKVPTCVQDKTGNCVTYGCCSEGQTAHPNNGHNSPVGYLCCDGQIVNGVCVPNQ